MIEIHLVRHKIKHVLRTDGENWCFDGCWIGKEEKREKPEIFADILQKLEETKQVYILGHDIPLSISKHLFQLLDLRRKQEAQKRGIPEEQFEFEDIIGLFLGIVS